MHLEIAPYLFLGSFIVVCVFNFIQCNICKIEDVKDYSKPNNMTCRKTEILSNLSEKRTIGRLKRKLP